MALTNFSSLTFLHLTKCGLFGKFPTAIFQLSKLENLRLDGNYGLTGSLPEFHFGNPLKALSVANTNFSDEFPASFGLLSSLKYFEVRNCHFSGLLSSLLSNLTDLTYFNIWYNYFKGSRAPFFINLLQLTVIGLSFSQFTFSEIPSVASLTNFHVLDHCFNHITGQFPSWLSNLTQLIIFNINNFLHNQDQLSILDLSYNNIDGQIPKWVLKMSANLCALFLVDNYLTGFEESSCVIPSGLLILDLSLNFLTGSLPIPPCSMLIYMVGENKFNGGIPPQFCNMNSPQILDLSHNNLTGIIPQCFGNLIGNKLKVIKLGHDNLQGKLPRSVASCKILEHLDLGNNQIKDTFPSWLGVLSQLKIFILHFNGFYGVISAPRSDILFPKRRIIDRSHNEFVGPLPMDYFKRWNVMANLDGESTTYLHADFNLFLNNFLVPFQVTYSMAITNKGKEMEYTKILKIYTVIDLSCNKFAGEIPEVVATLKRLQLLNLSHNMLIGPIPPALGDLIKH
ncbi:hypothetical protein SLA2020_020380 [Shorea laevis]